MLTPRLTYCEECSNIPSLIEEIDCKLAKLGNNMYNNITLMLNQPVPTENTIDLLMYKRILWNKYANPLYASNYSVNAIASKVKLLKFRQ